MFRSFFRPLSANGLQVLLNQGLALVLFLMLARVLDKEAFGLLQGTLGFLMLLFGILSFGIDQLLVRKIAGGAPPAPWIATALLHQAITGGIACGLLLFPYFYGLRYGALLPLLAFGKWMLSFSTVFKSAAAGAERFGRLLRMSVISSIVKVLGLLVLLRLGAAGLRPVLWLFVVADALEGAGSAWLYVRSGTAPDFSGCRRRYGALLAEAAPQAGAVLFAAALARFDWLWLAARTPAATVAEYSFAYKAFETAQLPLLIIAPLLVPRFTRVLHGKESALQLHRLRRAEMAIALLTVALLNGLWTPLADWVSAGKYGAVNRTTIALLSLALPLLYYNNFLWSLHFANGSLRFIFRLFAGTFAVNAVANLVLIPVWGKEGAATAFVLALLVQTLGYHAAALPHWRLRLRPAEATTTGPVRM